MHHIPELLVTNGFIQAVDTYILFTTYGEFILKTEYRINERYTVRDYVINTDKETFSGLIYTNDLGNFSQTLHRLLRRFHSSNSEINNSNSESVRVLEHI